MSLFIVIAHWYAATQQLGACAVPHAHGVAACGPVMAGGWPKAAYLILLTTLLILVGGASLES